MGGPGCAPAHPDWKVARQVVFVKIKREWVKNMNLNYKSFKWKCLESSWVCDSVKPAQELVLDLLR